MNVNPEKFFSHDISTDDLGQIKPGYVVVSPVRPPRAMGLVLTAQQTQSLPGQLCIAFRVEALGAVTSDDPAVLRPRVGQHVLLRNALLEPLSPSTNLLVVDGKHILAIVRGEPPAETDGPDAGRLDHLDGGADD